MKALITGATGFVGSYLSNLLVSEGFDVWGTAKNSEHQNQIFEIDLRDEDRMLELINNIQPEFIFHLAGQSSVKVSWEQKIETFETNVLGTISLYESIRKSKVSTTVKILSIGSSEEYGKISEEYMPISEDAPLNPISPYGVSKASMYLTSMHYHLVYGMNIIHVRPFNHIGPRQRRGFVTADFAYQVATIEKNNLEPIIEVGNLSSKRDFLDVRDIVRAYYHIIQKGRIGEVYNICSGRPIEILNILEKYLSMSERNIEVKVKQELIRPVDIPIYFGENKKLTNELGWNSSIPLEESLQDILNYWRITI